MPPLPLRLALVLLALPALASCGGSGGGGGGGGGPFYETEESEGNDTAASADQALIGAHSFGDVTVAGDVDYWKFSASFGQVLRFNLFGVRRDQATWDANSNVPRLTLLQPDGTTVILRHDFSGNFGDAWNHQRHDLDIPAWRAPAAGTYYLCITQDDQASNGGQYAFEIDEINPSNPQFESEPAGGDTNGGPGLAQGINDGTLFGFYENDGEDWYEFTVLGPTLVFVEMIAYRNGTWNAQGDYYDPIVDLIDVDGATVLESSDDTFFRDPVVSYKLTLNGTYYLRVREFATSNASAPYVLDFDRFAANIDDVEDNDIVLTAQAIGYDDVVAGDVVNGDPDFFAFSGTQGDMVRIWQYTAQLGGNVQAESDAADVTLLLPDGVTPAPSAESENSTPKMITTILQQNGTYYVRVTTAGLAQADYCFELRRPIAAAYEDEPNDTIGTADTLDGSDRAAGVIDVGTDNDMFDFNTTQVNQLVTVRVYAKPSVANTAGPFDGFGSTLAPRVTIRDDTGVAVATSEDPPPAGNSYAYAVTTPIPTVQVTYVAPAIDTYYVDVESSDGSGSTTHYYVVERR